MIWMTWRQFRTQAWLSLAVAVLVGGYLVVLGLQVRHTYSVDLAQCGGRPACLGQSSLTSRYDLRISLLGYLLIALPGVIGVFWGATLITRELEAGTHRLVWNQSVTRRRWLAARLGLVGLFAMAVAGLYSLLLTWAASPFDRLKGNRFSPLLFDARDLTPIGYAAFGFMLGVTLGLVIRRTVPAMAVTLVVFAVVQVLVPTAIRPDYAPQVRESVPLTAHMIADLSMIGAHGELAGVDVPGGPWVVSTSSMLDTAGHQVGNTAWYANCMAESMAELPVCLAHGNIHVEVSVQPANRFWDFQWRETAIFTGLAVVLAGLCFWRVRGRVS